MKTVHSNFLSLRTLHFSCQVWSVFDLCFKLAKANYIEGIHWEPFRNQKTNWIWHKFEKSNRNLIKLTSLVVVVLPTKIRVAILASLAFEGRSTASTMKCLLAGFFKRQGVRSKEIHRRIRWKTVHNYSTWKHFCFLSKVKWAFSTTTVG